jgi:hypothetical protein
MKPTNEDLLDIVQDIMDLLQQSGSPQNAALVLLTCHAINYEKHSKVPVDKYMDIYRQQFKTFLKEAKNNS